MTAMENSKLSKKNSGLPAEVAEHKPCPVPEEDSFTPPDDDSAEVKYNTKKNKHNP